MFKKVLIANRGEIAVRVIRACKEWGISTVAVHSDVDADSMHVRLADESVCIGSHQPQNSYLNIGAIMSAVDLTGAEAIHPGYGFLSENAKFAEVVQKHGIKFIGPSAELIRQMGDKIEAKKIAKKYGLPIIEGSEGGVKSFDEAKNICAKIGFPVLIKAAGGGGGKGMKIVEKESELENLFLTAKSEAKKYFGNDELYIEKYFKHPRHIEVQILSGKNRTVHLQERDCSVQRRHQKLIEETPSPVLSDEIRDKLLKSTVNMVEKLGYEGAGTIEYIYEDGKFYFLEMNTRVQVEHPVTEVVTGIDIIKEQLWIAFTGNTALEQSDISPRGHAIECRINAENNNFKINIKDKIIIGGSRFDATNLLKSINSQSKNNPLVNFTKEIEINLENLVTKSEIPINNFRLIGKIEKGKFINISAKSEFSKDKYLDISLKKDPNNKKILEIYSDVPKALLADYKFFEGLKDGKLFFNSVIDEDGSVSKITIENFKVVKAPAFATLLTLADLGGVADLLSGEGMSFDILEISLNENKDVTKIEEILALGSSISVIMDGYTEKKTGLISLSGTLVPAKTLNSLVSKIPVVGNILVGDKVGEGVFGVSFKMKGLPGDVKTTVNPVKTLTPRFITRALEKMKKN